MQIKYQRIFQNIIYNGIFAIFQKYLLKNNVNQNPL